MSASALSATLEAALARAIRAAWHELNVDYFKRALEVPRFALGDSERRLGQWRPETRCIEISRRLVLERGWGVVVEVLKHEMAHQYAHEVLHATDEAAHGPAFRTVCQRLGFDAAAAGMPAPSASIDASGDASGGQGSAGKVLARIAKLLALAESPNVHEAEAAMAEAQRLMLKHNLAATASAAAAGYGFRHLGRATGRVSESERLLAVILGDHFFVEVIWVHVWRALEGKRGTMLEICGSLENLELASHVHAFLTHTAERLWQDYARTRGLRSRRDRRTYLAGVMAGFREKLAAQKVRCQAEGLIWVGDGDLEAFYRRRHPRIRWTRHAGNRRTEAHAHGKEAGRGIVLHRAVNQPSEKRGLLLTDRRG